MKTPEWPALVARSTVQLRFFKAPTVPMGSHFTIKRHYLGSDEEFLFEIGDLRLSAFETLESTSDALRKEIGERSACDPGGMIFNIRITTDDQEFEGRTAHMQETQNRFGTVHFGDLDRFFLTVHQCVSSFWGHKQCAFVEEGLVREQTGMGPARLMNEYCKVWSKREGNPSISAEEGLRRLYLAMLEAAVAMKAGDTITMWSDMAHFLCLETEEFEEAARLRERFPHLVVTWQQMDAERHAFVNQAGMATDEGIAEWSMFVPPKLYAMGVIQPLSEFVLKSLTDEAFLKDSREQILRRSSSNPYRKGFVALEDIENSSGLWFVRLGAAICAWPLRTLGSRLPLPLLKKIVEDPRWNPDYRLEKLVRISRELSEDSDPPPRFAHMRFVQDKMDDDLPAIDSFCYRKLTEFLKTTLR